jgi:adenylosuccinate synthase
MSLWVVVGGQYGSEGKGKVSAFIAKQENIDICVRCGGPNSGHSFVDEHGATVVLRQLPTGFINPRTRLLIPAGALIDPEIVKHEIESLGLTPERVGIDRKCFIIDKKDREEEQRLHLGERLSSTLCGVGAAQARRVLRGEDAKLARDANSEYPWMSRYLTDVSDEVNNAVNHDKKVLIEGTQGFGLSLYSDHYPKTTSRDTTAAGFLSEVGVSPRLVTEIVVVFRTFPIRVAGAQAGLLNQETSWEQIQKESGYPSSVEERTSVTRKVRRVSRFDWELAKRALVLNRATRVAINGLDLLNYNNFRVDNLLSLDRASIELSRNLAQLADCDLLYLGTGPGHLFSENLRTSEDSVCYSGMRSRGESD